MTSKKSAPLFFGANLTQAQVRQIAIGVIEPAEVDLVEFPEEAGGEVARELGVPFLDGMDEIQVDEAQFLLRAGTRASEITYKAVNAPGGNGVIVSLDKPARIRKIDINYTPPAPDPLSPARVVVRPATPRNGSFEFSPPIYSVPDFPAPGAMFDRVLTGMSATDIQGGGKMLAIPPLLGPALLIQIAKAKDDDGAAKLDPLKIAPQVRGVTIDAAPDGLEVALAADGSEVPLWGHPGLLLPEAGQQQVSFLPLAQKHLSSRLKKPEGKLALTIPLKFRSKSAGNVEVTGKNLVARYRVNPLGADPLKVRLEGDWLDVTLSAPTALQPLGSSIDFIVKLDGRALNDGSAEPARERPGSGIRVTVSRVVAALTPFLPLAGTPAGSVLPLASARVLVSALKDSEVVLEIREDVAGAPGQVLASPPAKQIASSFSGWLEFVLPKPLPVSAGKAPLWTSLRVNRGEALWFASGAAANPVRVSADKGRTWAEPAPALGPLTSMVVQLFHVLPDPLAAPAIQLFAGQSVLTKDLLAVAERKGDREFARTALSLPAAIHNLLASAAGGVRAATTLKLFSRSVLDLTVENARLFYDPFQPGHATEVS